MFLQRLTDEQLTQTAIGSAAASILIAVVAFAYDGGKAGAVLAPLLAIPAILTLIEKNDRRLRAAWARNVRAAFHGFDLLQDGKRWKGSEAELVHMADPQHVDKKDRQLQLAILGKTKRGAWFILSLLTEGADVIGLELREVDENEASTFTTNKEAAFKAAELA